MCYKIIINPTLPSYPKIAKVVSFRPTSHGWLVEKTQFMANCGGKGTLRV